MLEGQSGWKGIMIHDKGKGKNIACYGYYENEEMILQIGTYEEMLDKLQKDERAGRRKDNRIVLLMLGELLGLGFVMAAAFSRLVFQQFIGVLIFCVLSAFPIFILLYSSVNAYDSRGKFHAFRKHHGAEHTVVSAWYSKKALTVDSLKQQSIYDNECGTVYNGSMVVLAAVVGWVAANIIGIGLLRGAGMVLGTVIVLYILLLVPFNPLKLLQSHVVERPGDRDYELALAVIKKIAENIEKGQ